MTDPVERRLAAIMFTDIVGYTALMAESEETGLQVRKRHRALVRPLVEQYHGESIEARGDESLSVFPTALDAVNCALAIEEHLRDDAELKLHLGIHLGDLIVQDGEVSGDGVNIASRICALSEGGGLCVSGEVHRSIRNQPGIETTALGEQTLKNVPEPVAVYSVMGTAAPPRPVAKRAAVSRGRAFPRAARAAVALVVVAIGAGWWLYRPATDLAPIRSIAVLPLENLSGDPEQEYFADGMTEALIGDLAKIGALSVISRTSIMRYKQSDKSLPEIAEELGVDGVLEGTVMRAGDRVRITTQLIDARNDHHLWSERYDRELSDVLALQSDVARAVARQIELTLTPQEESRIANTRRVNPAAHEAYLKGRFFWNQRGESLHKAIDYFQRAIEIDPQHATAYAGLADTYALLPIYVPTPARDVMPKARAAALKALELDDSLASAHATLGMIRTYDLDWAGAEGEFRRAAELSPSDATVHVRMSFYLASTGRTEEGLAELRRAQELDPLSVTVQRSMGRQYYWARQYERAIEAVRRSLELDPDSPQARSILARALARLGRLDEAAREIDLASDNLSDRVARAHVRAMAGQRPAALRILKEIELDPSARYFVPTQIAAVHAALGDPDRAFEWLEVGVRERKLRFGILAADPDLDPLRSDPRFQDLLHRIGLPES